MKPSNPGSRRKKIILFYTLAVVLPGIILGYMAYRGIRNDQALLEKESRRRLEVKSQAFFMAIDSSLVNFMNEQIPELILSTSNPANSNLLMLFVRDSTGSKKLITHKLLYVPIEMLPVQSEQVNLQTDFEEGLRLEFIGHRFSEALQFYQIKALKTKNSAEKIQTLVASARLYSKMNQPNMAKSLYDEIRKDHKKCLFNGQIPVELIADLEILKINKILGEKDEIRNNSRQCLELLLHPSCDYDENQFGLFYESFKEMIPKTDPVIDSLFTELEIQRIRTDYLIRLITGPDPIVTNGNYNLKDTKNEVTSIPINSGELVALYLSGVRNNGSQTCMVIDFPTYLKSIFDKLIQKLDPNNSTNIKIQNNSGRLIFSRVIGEESSYLSFSFPENLPPWKLLLSESRPGFIATLMNSGSGIYLFILILIALLMILGFVFTIYTLNEELRLNKLKSEFISNVSHELKSPLTSIRMMTEMLFHNRVQSEERKSAYYSSMLEESERLSHLIDNILDFSRMEDDRKKYDFVDLDLNELLLRFLESTHERLLELGFDISYSHPDRIPVIRADKNAVLQVIYNLVDNAIKFSGASRQIDINLFSEEDELLLCVKDYGIGISVNDQAKIFDRFYRCNEPQQMGIKGSGIGLTIVKKIIEAHKGYLTLESRPGEGSTFCVHLPILKNT